MSERQLLQIAVALASLVPIVAGATGVLLGPDMVAAAAVPAAADSHYRYLSGLLLGVGGAFVTTVPRIEHRSTRFRILTAIVVTGGLARLLSLILHGYAGAPMLYALAMELCVTPALLLWQHRIARQPRR
jgi:hypothetical protein